MNKNEKLTLDKVRNKCHELYGDEYTILSNVYIGNKIKMDIIHNKCGIEFKSNYNNFTNNHGCPTCGGSKKLTMKSIKEKCYEIYCDEYSIISEDYINNKTKIKIKHNECQHEWLVNTNNFLCNRSGCPNCSISKGENMIKQFLNQNNISYNSQKTFNDCVHINNLKFDFYLPEHNTCIEFDGIQHFKPVEKFGGLKTFEITKIRDGIKNSYCANNKINLLRIPYTKLSKINEILNLILQI
jgi:very-short-patch-repair endonuclease